MPGSTRYQQGNEIFDILLYLPSVTFPTLGANASATNTLSVPGVQQYDLLSWNMQAPPAHLTVDNMYVSANGVITILWGTDSTGITGSTVGVVLSVCRAENAASLPGGAALPNSIL